MRLSRRDFDSLIAKNKLTLTFIGMSGIGKTHRSRQFVPLGFKHRSYDDAIAPRISSLTPLKNVTDVGVWMGQPYSEGYRDRERKYLKLEEVATNDILGTVKSNTVIDTTGSVVYLSNAAQRRLKKNSLVVYFEASPEMYDRMLEVYLDDPKPVIWGNIFKHKNSESEQATLRRCYPALMKFRTKKYRDLADITIPYEVMSDSWWEGERFFEAIREHLEKDADNSRNSKSNSVVWSKVIKFGGTSMGSPEAIRKVIEIIRKPRKHTKTSAVVVSAMSGVTDELIALAQDAATGKDSYKKRLDTLVKRHIATLRALIKRQGKESYDDVQGILNSLSDAVHGVRLVGEISPRVLDHILSHGERLSASILCSALLARGTSCEVLNASSVIVTDSDFGEAAVDFKTTNQNIRAHFARSRKLQIVTGFIAASQEGVVTTLGRGGSDYTASIVGAALGVSSIEIWTDVSGVRTADPRKVKNTQHIAAMTYQEASEMSHFGAKVIHPPTMLPARKKGIPILIKNTFDPGGAGTLIGKMVPTLEKSGGEPLAKGISSISNVSMLRIEGSGMVGVYGSASRIFDALSRSKINVILITQSSSEYSISIAVAPKDAERARHAIDREFTLEHQTYLIDPVVVEHGFSIVAIVGERMRHRSGVAARLFEALGKHHVNVVAVAQGSSELNVSIVIQNKDEIRALNAIHEAFFTPRRKRINVFLVGTGLIGSTLLKQIAAQISHLESDYECVINVAAVANKNRMLFKSTGINPKNYKKVLGGSKMKMEIGQFIAEMKTIELPNSVFVDCTASAEVANRYTDVLMAGISVVTPNKKANSGSLAYYQELKHAAGIYNTKFLYETNVGAGLPVISALNDLVLSGDRVQKIEAVLSGTLSYIFNSFTGDTSFSQIVKKAKSLGYTEPDPRDDLNGMDVARKILILGRTIGLPLELKDIKVEGLLSKKAANARSVEAFFAQLEKEDSTFDEKKRAAEKAGKRLRYIATLEKGRARVSLQAVPSTHSFFQLSGSDNIISFTTERYKNTPLVIKGPGAGAEVTAAGVFADILRTSGGI